MKSRSMLFLLFFLSIGNIFLQAQGLTAQVIESVFYVQPNGGGEERMIREFGLNMDSLYLTIEGRIKEILNLKELGLLQNSPFLYTKRKNKNFKNLTKEDQNRAKSAPADIYLIIFLDVNPPYPSLMSKYLIKTAITLEVYIFDKNLLPLQKMKGKKANTGISFSPDEDDYDDDFFDFDRDSFLYLFDKALKKL
ncbi:hypothetical protein [Aquiflexum sp.]|uniref:hypothetical protein n=1 Tax=Aquiflexum sp. TaxID=1872584 RepID=UPI0035944584